MNNSTSLAVAELAARLVVDEGMEYGPAKRKAADALGRRHGRQSSLPSNEEVEDQVREHLNLFCAETQPAELRALRELALVWMDRLAPFRPHLGGGAWRGTATRLSNLVFDLYCDDVKSTEIAFINLEKTVEQRGGGDQDPIVLCTTARCPELPEPVTLLFVLQDADQLRGALKPDTRGRTWRGDAHALRRLLQSEAVSP
jgi:hypothetical protein